MKTVAYLLYGNKREYHLELTYSVLSAAHFLRKQPSDVRIVLITDESNLRPDLPIEYLVFTQDDFARWTRSGTYNHEAKVHGLLLALDQFQGSVALIDTDTHFRAHPDNLFHRIGPGRALMQAVDDDAQTLENIPYWRPILQRVRTPVAGYRVNAQSRMFNSGVIGVHHSARVKLNDVLTLINELHSIAPVFNIEQFAFSTVLDGHFDLNVCPDLVHHYWGYERRFIHAQVGALFPDFTPEIFETKVSCLPSVGYPAKSRLDQFRARLKDLQRRQGGDYRFAYLAYRSALSNTDRLMANAWAHVALDVLEAGTFLTRYIHGDFWRMRPERLDSYPWLAAETKRRWENYWRLLG